MRYLSVGAGAALICLAGIAFAAAAAHDGGHGAAMDHAQAVLHVAEGGAAGAAPHAGHAAPSPAWDNEAALRYSQDAIGRQIGAYALTDQDGRAVDFTALRGKPVVVSLIYTSCAHVCPLITRHLGKAAEVARDALGDDSFNLVSVGFDAPVDTPARMRLYAAERSIDTRRWGFWSGDETTIRRLAADLGFIYYPSAKGFDHLSQITILDAQGRVYRQVYGETFAPPALAEPLKELVFGQVRRGLDVGDWMRGIRLFCTVYDQRSGRYLFDYSVFMSGFAGLLSLGATVVFLVHAWRGRARPSA